VKNRPSFDASNIYRSDDPMDQFNLDHLATLDASLHYVQRERVCYIRIVIEVIRAGVKQ